MHLWVLIISSFLVSGTFYLCGQGVISAFVAACVFALLFAFGALCLLPQSVQRSLTNFALSGCREKMKAFALRAAWDEPALDGHIRRSFELASKEGHLANFQRQMARRDPATMKIGDVWTALELSRVNAGLKLEPERSVFRKKNSMRA